MNPSIQEAANNAGTVVAAWGLDLLEPNAEQEAIAQARAEERRQSAIQLVSAIYRLIKILGIHAESNQAVAVLVNGMVAAVKDFCERAGTATASVLYADDTIFVNGQMLRVSRDAYTTGVALGGLFERIGISEVTFQSTVDASQVMEFARVMHGALRDRSQSATILQREIPGVKLRRIDGQGKEGETVEELPLTQRIAHTYAASIVIMRGLHEELGKGNFQLPHRIKRVAQKLVKDAEDAPHVVIGLVTARSLGSDEASLAVGSAALAILMAKQLTNDRVLLANLATTALLFDVGRYAFGRRSETNIGVGISRFLNEDELDRLPAATAAVLTVLGRIHTAAITRTVISFEALWQRRAARLGPLYGGRRTPMLLSRLIATARTFIELITPTPTVPALAVDDAVHLLTDAAATEIDRACIKLLVATLGFFPIGTVVELNTGELAIVTAVPSLATQFARPPVRIMYDESGNLLPRPLDVDLAAPPGPGQPLRYVRRTVEYDAQQMRAMRSYILSSIEGKAPAQHPALLRPSAEPAPEPARPEAVHPHQGKRVVSAPGATRQVDWEDYKKLATPQPRVVAEGKTVVAAIVPARVPVPAATRQVNWEDYKKLATPQPRDVVNDKTTVAPAISERPSSPDATRQVNWEDYKKLATPQPRDVVNDKTTVAPVISERPSSPDATRQVNWEDYKKLATPQPRDVVNDKTAVAPAISERPSSPDATRQVNWQDYKKLATPQPRVVADETTVAAPAIPVRAPAPTATRQVNWEDYKKLATLQPRVVADQKAIPSQPPVASSGVSVPVARASSAPPAQPVPETKAAAPTRMVNWGHYHRIKAEQPKPSVPPVDASEPLDPNRDDTDLLLAGVEQDDTDLLLAGVEQDHVQPEAETPSKAPVLSKEAAAEVDELFRAFVNEEPFPAPAQQEEPFPRSPSSPPPRSPAPPSRSPAPPPRSSRWSATEALLRELDDAATNKRPQPPRPTPKRKG